MGAMVIVAFKPKPGCADELEALVREHAPYLRALGLVTDRPAQAMRAKDGTIVEVFEWHDGAAKAAHHNPEVLQLWERFGKVCDYIPLVSLPEATNLFADFVPLEL